MKSHHIIPSLPMDPKMVVGRKTALPMNRKLDRSSWEAHPHPGPLPRGEGDVVPASGEFGNSGFALVQRLPSNPSVLELK
jgi:hypothetical protein